MALTPAEEAVRKLARIPGNTICPNCGTQKKFGFSTICIKFLTFVCNECKSSHQAISHRCKSLTMSSWDDKEVQMLRDQGGNDRARRTWLKNAPPCGSGGRPKGGVSDISVYKSFVIDAYERRKYYGEDTGSGDGPGVATASASSSNTPPRPSATSTTASTRRQPTVAPIAQAPTSAPLPVTDLLDFGSSATTNQASSNANFSAFDADFGAFSSPSTNNVGQNADAPSSSPFDGAFQSTPSTNSSQIITQATNSSSNSAFQADFSAFASAPAPVAASSSGFAFMNQSSTGKDPSNATNKSIMGNASGSMAGNAISSIDVMTLGGKNPSPMMRQNRPAGNSFMYGGGANVMQTAAGTQMNTQTQQQNMFMSNPSGMMMGNAGAPSSFNGGFGMTNNAGLGMNYNPSSITPMTGMSQQQAMQPNMMMQGSSTGMAFGSGMGGMSYQGMSAMNAQTSRGNTISSMSMPQAKKKPTDQFSDLCQF